MTIQSDNIIARIINIEEAREIFQDYQDFDITQELLTNSLDCLEEHEWELVDIDDLNDVVNYVMHELRSELDYI